MERQDKSVLIECALDYRLPGGDGLRWIHVHPGVPFRMFNVDWMQCRIDYSEKGFTL